MREAGRWPAHRRGCAGLRRWPSACAPSRSIWKKPAAFCWSGPAAPAKAPSPPRSPMPPLLVGPPGRNGQRRRRHGAVPHRAPSDSDGLMVMEARRLQSRQSPRPQRLCRPERSRRRGKHRRGLAPPATPKMSAILSARLRLKRVIVTGLDRTSPAGRHGRRHHRAAPRLAHVTYGPRADDPLETLAPDAAGEDAAGLRRGS